MSTTPNSLPVAQLLIGQSEQYVILAYRRRYSGKTRSWANCGTLIAFAKVAVNIWSIA
ncbi:hypothetical protein [Burkholderia sp. BE12]|uniref:hypothetical protein n=1 Tax=Burkholderia sp. BE12 TaxID=2082394 RepID=UPI00131A2626|nr:hypothetical protein [Burkholderia sp. BE12]